MRLHELGRLTLMLGSASSPVAALTLHAAIMLVGSYKFIAGPEYAHGYAGVIKNALANWCGGWKHSYKLRV